MASSSWEALGETFYRRQEIYSLQWSLADLSDYIIAGARWGGPLAIARDDKKPVLLGKGGVGKRKISIYTSSGGLLQTIQWDSLSRIVALGWTLSESLVVLTQDGTYRLYPLSTSASLSSLPVYTQHSLGSEAQETGVLEARIYEEGMVVLLGSLSFVEVRGWEGLTSEGTSEASAGMKGGKVLNLAKYALTEVPNCWCVIPAELSTSGGVEVLMSTGVTVVRLDEIEYIDQRITRGPFVSITVSPNGRFLSLISAHINSSPQLWVTSSDFTRSLSEFDLGGEGEVGAPSQNVWCGSNTVVVAWDRTVVMVGPFGETLKYFYSEPIHLIAEIDGTRIISRDYCEFLQKVPQSLQDVFRPGSASPSAILFEASELFEKRSPKADEQIRNIKSELVGAVDALVDAAGREFEVHWQKKLLKAASFGKTFLDLYNPTQFVQMTQHLRVLNAARYYEIGIPLTFDQYQAQSPSHLISRLTSRSQHLLSLRISTFLSLSSAPVLKHWAQSRITDLPAIGLAGGREGGEEEQELVRRVVDMLRENESEISAADIAETAWRSGRVNLATKLLNHEPRAVKQVPLLLNMKEDDLAIVKSIESGDPDLVSTVLLSLHSTHSLGNFFRLIDNKPDAAALLQVYAKENDVELLRDFYYQDDRRIESGVLALKESLGTNNFGDKVAKVRIAAKSFGEDKDCAFETKTIEDQIRLLAFQQTLDQETGTMTNERSYIGMSVSQTIKTCIVAGLDKKAEKIRSDWKVSDKRWWYLKLSAHIATRDFVTLLTFSKSKRSPIGYEPFVIALIASGSPKEAANNYVGRCDSSKRVELFVRCGDWIAAGKECVRKGSRDELVDLRGRCPNSILAAQLDELLGELRS